MNTVSKQTGAKIMKKFNILLAVTTLISMLPLYGMEENSTYILEEQAQRIEEAKKYNKNHKFLIKDLLLDIFSHCEQKNRKEDITIWMAYGQIKTLSAIHATCQFFNQLMPFKKIIEFCKTLKSETKNEFLKTTISLTHHNSCDENLIFSALIQAGADATIKYQGIPLFFYAKSTNIAQELIKRGCDIHTKVAKGFDSSYGISDVSKEFIDIFKEECKEEGNVLSHVINKEYQSELMEFYLQKKVVPHQDILHRLVLKLKDHCANEKLMNEFLKKSELLLAIVPDSIKNNFNWETVTPLDKLREQLLFGDIHLEYKFFEQVVDLFIGYGCQTVHGAANYYFRKSPAFSHMDQNPILYEYDSFDIPAVEKDDNPIEFVDKKYDSLIEFVKKNNVEGVCELIENGRVDINERDEMGNTLLIVATMQKNKKMVEYLLNYGADPELSNNFKYTALDIAMENGDDDLATLLIDLSEANGG